MGWLYTEKIRGEKIVDHLKRTEFTGCDIVAISVRLRSAIVAYRSADQIVRAAVVLLDHDRQKAMLGMKVIDEELGPFCYEAPKKLLDLLSPTSDLTAKRWRDLCRIQADRKEKIKGDLTGKKIDLYGRSYILKERYRRSWIAHDLDSTAIVMISPRHLLKAIFL